MSAEYTISTDYEEGKTRFFFSRLSDFQGCKRKLEKKGVPFVEKQGGGGDSFFLTVDLAHTAKPSAIIRGLPRGISKNSAA